MRDCHCGLKTVESGELATGMRDIYEVLDGKDIEALICIFGTNNGDSELEMGALMQVTACVFLVMFWRQQ